MHNKDASHMRLAKTHGDEAMSPQYKLSWALNANWVGVGFTRKQWQLGFIEWNETYFLSS